MTKAEIIEAINNTIVPNGEKAITAESLANLLIEMANATPEGGSGVLNLHIDENMEGNVTDEMKAHNAEIYTQLLQDPYIPVFVKGFPVICDSINTEANTITFLCSMAYASDPETYYLMGLVISLTLSADGSLMVEM